MIGMGKTCEPKAFSFQCMAEFTTKKKNQKKKKKTANGNLLYGSGSSDRGSVTIQRDGMGREMGRRSGGSGHGCTYD